MPAAPSTPPRPDHAGERRLAPHRLAASGRRSRAHRRPPETRRPPQLPRDAAQGRRDAVRLERHRPGRSIEPESGRTVWTQEVAPGDLEGPGASRTLAYWRGDGGARVFAVRGALSLRARPAQREARHHVRHRRPGQSGGRPGRRHLPVERAWPARRPRRRHHRRPGLDRRRHAGTHPARRRPRLRRAFGRAAVDLPRRAAGGRARHRQLGARAPGKTPAAPRRGT